MDLGYKVPICFAFSIQGVAEHQQRGFQRVLSASRDAFYPKIYPLYVNYHFPSKGFSGTL